MFIESLNHTSSSDVTQTGHRAGRDCHNLMRTRPGFLTEVKFRLNFITRWLLCHRDPKETTKTLRHRILFLLYTESKQISKIARL